MFSRVLALAVVSLSWLPVEAVPATEPLLVAGCPERPPCRGCRDGPGYRGPDGTCVGFRNLPKVCGSPPETRRVFENAPGTGANRECALAPR